MPEWLRQLLMLQQGYRGTGAMGNTLPQPPRPQTAVRAQTQRANTGTRQPLPPRPVPPAPMGDYQDVEDNIRLQLLAKQGQVPLPSFSQDVPMATRNRLISRLVQGAMR